MSLQTIESPVGSFWNLNTMPHEVVIQNIECKPDDAQDKQLKLKAIIDKITLLYSSYFTEEGLKKMSPDNEVTLKSILDSDDLIAFRSKFSELLLEKFNHKENLGGQFKNKEVKIKLRNKLATTDLYGDVIHDLNLKQKYSDIYFTLVFDDSRVVSLSWSKCNHTFNVKIEKLTS
jgi:hypothetical protein